MSATDETTAKIRKLQKIQREKLWCISNLPMSAEQASRRKASFSIGSRNSKQVSALALHLGFAASLGVGTERVPEARARMPRAEVWKNRILLVVEEETLGKQFIRRRSLEQISGRGWPMSKLIYWLSFPTANRFLDGFLAEQTLERTDKTLSDKERKVGEKRGRGWMGLFC